MRQNDRSTSRFVPRLRHAALALAAFALLAAGAGSAKAGGDDGESLWGGSYAGVFVGFGQADNRIVDVEGFANWGEPGWAVDYDESAPVGGALIGTTLAIGGMPLRLELDAMTGGGGLAASDNTLDPEGLDETVETSFGWIVTARAGVEYALAEGMALFATAGIAAAQIERAVTDIDSPDDGTPPYVDDDDSFSDDSTAVGWVIGAGVEALEAAGLIYWPDKQGGKPRYKKYLSTLQGRYASDIITDIPPVGARADERQHFPTQKPLALIHRFIAASSNEGDMIFDPFCGCATACIVAQELKRQWVGIDISPKAADLVVDRMKLELRLFFAGIHRTDVPERTDLGKIISYNDAKNKRALYGEQGGYCHGCEHHFSPRNLTVDHIIPRSKGGTDHISNLQLLCGACNSLKGDRPQEYLLVCLTDKGWIKRKKAA